MMKSFFMRPPCQTRREEAKRAPFRAEGENRVGLSRDVRPTVIPVSSESAADGEVGLLISPGRAAPEPLVVSDLDVPETAGAERHDEPQSDAPHTRAVEAEGTVGAEPVVRLPGGVVAPAPHDERFRLDRRSEPGEGVAAVDRDRNLVGGRSGPPRVAD